MLKPGWLEYIIQDLEHPMAMNSNYENQKYWIHPVLSIKDRSTIVEYWITDAEQPTLDPYIIKITGFKNYKVVRKWYEENILVGKLS